MVQKLTFLLSSAIVEGYGLAIKNGEEVKRDMIGNILRMVMVWNLLSASIIIFDIMISIYIARN